MPKLKNQGNYYGATPDRPYHLSVGAVVLNADNDVICLHYPSIDGIKDIYKLPTGTVHKGETLEDTLHRRCREELGCSVKIITFLGTQITRDVWWGELGTPTPMEKSVMFFLAKAVTEDSKLTTADENYEVKTKGFSFLIESLQTLKVKDGMRDFNQAEMIIRAKEWIETHPDLLSPTL